MKTLSKSNLENLYDTGFHSYTSHGSYFITKIVESVSANIIYSTREKITNEIRLPAIVRRFIYANIN
jgi:hypothetical protein